MGFFDELFSGKKVFDLSEKNKNASVNNSEYQLQARQVIPDEDCYRLEEITVDSPLLPSNAKTLAWEELEVFCEGIDYTPQMFDEPVFVQPDDNAQFNMDDMRKKANVSDYDVWLIHFRCPDGHVGIFVESTGNAQWYDYTIDA